MSFHKKHLITDFQQTKLNPDFSMARFKLLSLKGNLSGRRSRTIETISTRYTSPFTFNKLNSFMVISQPQLLLWIFLNPFLLKLLLSTFIPQGYGPSNSFKLNSMFGRGKSWNIITDFVAMTHFTLVKFSLPVEAHNRKVGRVLTHSNLLPNQVFSSTITKYVSSLHLNNKIREDFIPMYFHTLIRFVESATGKRFILQFYPFLHQNIPLMILVRYKQ